MNTLHGAAAPRFDSVEEATYLSFLNLPVLAGCVGAWAIVILLAAGLGSLF